MFMEICAPFFTRFILEYYDQ